MKKIISTLITVFTITHVSAQAWFPNTSTNGDIVRDGNVGIGMATTPYGKLHLAIPNAVAPANTTGLYIDHKVTGNYSFAQLIKVQSDLTKAFFVTRVNGTNETNVFQIWGNGTVNAKNVYAESVTVTTIALSSWPDYVFNKNYKLRSLKELETYIIENKHLPGVPSADDIQKNGMNIYEVNKALLEKVEEMSLHMIQMNKEIESLKEQIKK